MNKSVMTVLLCCNINFKKLKGSSKIIMLTFMLVIIIGLQLIDLNKYETVQGGTLTAWILPYLFSPTMLLCVGLLFVALFSDAPYCDSFYTFVIVRSGKRAWFFGTVLYIMCLSCLASICIFILTILLGSGYMDFSEQLNSAYFEGFLTFGLIGMDLLSIFVLWMGTCWIGLLILFCNLSIQETSGVPIASFLCTYSYFISIFPVSPYALYVSPISWINIANIRWSSTKQIKPPFSYVCLFYLFSAIIMIIVSWLKLKFQESELPKKYE